MEVPTRIVKQVCVCVCVCVCVYIQNVKIIAFTFTFSHLADTFIQSDLQMKYKNNDN